jgi:ubiquinone/menaquinone biosynthesis C-methylase UbiE
MPINDYSIISNKYASLDNSGTAFLAFKQIPDLLKRHAIGKKTLDYGCGSGSSTLFLNEIGLEVEGVDISQDMLQEAIQLNTSIPFNLIKSAKLPQADNTFDIVFSSFFLFEISSKHELSRVINEIYRVLKKEGVFIGVTGSEELYNHKWLSLDVDFEQNKYLSSGDIAKVLLKDAGLVVYDYYWTNNDYLEIIIASQFSLLETLFPLGENTDGYPWKDEKHFSPYVIYVLSK